MQGDDRVRFCAECRLNVFNVAGMTRPEAEQLVGQHEGRLCVRLIKRADGTVLTQDCPVGLRLVRRRLARLVAGTAAMLAFVTFGGWFAKGSSTSAASATGPLQRLANWLEPKSPPAPAIPLGGAAIAGDIMCPPRQPPVLSKAPPTPPAPTAR
jgi:hypothetical protein